MGVGLRDGSVSLGSEDTPGHEYGRVDWPDEPKSRHAQPNTPRREGGGLSALCIRGGDTPA